MFLRPYKRIKDGKAHTYYALVESERTPEGRRQRTVAYLGELNHDQERRWQRTVVFHNRHGDAQQLRLFPDDETVVLPDDPDIVRVRLKQVGWTNARRFGDVWLAWQLWRRLGLDEIVGRYVPPTKHTCRPADIVAIEVINRLCAPCSEFALAEHWYAATALADLLGVADAEVTKDRLYRTLDGLRAAQVAIEDDLQKQLQALFDLAYDLLLYDLTSTYFEGLAEGNDLAARGYSRDHRRDCKQVIVALVVTREGFPLAHFTLKGNTQDLATVQQVVTAVEKRFGQVQRVWVMDRGMLSVESLRFLQRSGRQYLLGLRRSALTKFAPQLRSRNGWQRLAELEDVEVKPVRRGRQHYLLARSKPRRQKERAMRRRQRRGLADGLRKLQARVAQGKVKNRDKILERLGRLQERYPKARTFVTVVVAKKGKPVVTWTWDVPRFRAALAADGAYVLQSNRSGWTAQESLGDEYAIGRGRESVPRAQERAALAAGVASVQRPCPGPRVRLRVGLRLVENAGPSGPASGTADADPQAGGAPLRPSRPQAATDDTGSGPAGTGTHPDRRHHPGDHRGAATTVTSRRTPRRGTEAHPGGPKAGTAGTAESRPAFLVKTCRGQPRFSRRIGELRSPSAQLRLGVSAPPVLPGQGVTFTATVAAQTPGSNTPQGTLTFSIDGTQQAPVSLVNGVATFIVSTLGVGGHSVTATYSGDVNFTGSASTPATMTVARATPSVTLTVSAPSIGLGQTITLNVAVTGPAGAPAPTGLVTLLDDGNTIGTATLSGGTASLTVSSLHAGTNNLTAVYSGDGSFVSVTSAASAVGVGTPNERYMDALYVALLHRHADFPGAQGFVNLLSAGGSGQMVARAIETSTEYETNLVQKFYQDILGRAADPMGLNAFVNFLAAGGTHEQAEAMLFGSAEFFQKSGGSNTAFLGALYQNTEALGRTIDAQGQTAFGAALASGGMSRVEAAAAILGSTEHAQRVIGLDHQQFLGRGTDPGSVAFSNGLASGQVRDEDVIAAILGSAEYRNAHST
jgi:hypothetical protein